MGTTLTGTTPQDTYDSLIKVTDNGPLSGTLKTLTDGLGNDSALALSTGAARVTGLLGIGTTPEAGFNLDILTALGSYPRISGSDQANVRLRFSNGGAGGRNYELIGGLAGANNSNFSIFDATASATRLTIDSTGNVGIGTSAPATILHVKAANATLRLEPASQNQSQAIELGVLNSSINAYAKIDCTNTITYDSNIRFFTNTDSSTTQVERMRITQDGYVRLASTSSGIQFNGDTAAANALDDYEEGTWTMGVSFGGASVGVTTSANTGTYTKIGRQVTVSGLLGLTSKGSSTGAAAITGLPFAIASGASNYSAASLRFDSITFTNQFQAYGGITSTNIELEEITLLGAVSALTNADFANSCSIMVSATYFV